MSETPGTVCVVVVGMAGSGKTSLVRALSAYACEALQDDCLFVNLDPAVIAAPSDEELWDIDIGDTIDYQKVMREFSLGPNGAILASLNMFATKFGQVVDHIKTEAPRLVVFDTPGQIEVFTWSASGQLITSALRQHFSTLVVYTIDGSEDQHTFISDVLYATSVHFRLGAPLTLTFTKADINLANTTLLQSMLARPGAVEFDGGMQGSLQSSVLYSLSELFKVFPALVVAAVPQDAVDRTAISEMPEFMEKLFEAAAREDAQPTGVSADLPPRTEVQFSAVSEHFPSHEPQSDAPQQGPEQDAEDFFQDVD